MPATPNAANVVNPSLLVLRTPLPPTPPPNVKEIGFVVTICSLDATCIVVVVEVPVQPVLETLMLREPLPPWVTTLLNAKVIGSVVTICSLLATLTAVVVGLLSPMVDLKVDMVVGLVVGLVGETTKRLALGTGIVVMIFNSLVTPTAVAVGLLSLIIN